MSVDIINKAGGTGEIRCGGHEDPQRPHNGLIARWDRRGVLLWCGDCRQPDGKRGRQHLVTWPQLFRLFLGLGEVKHD